ncbi:carboxylating nicotinate-nucleotide diphosphorylase [Corynebacterium callunae]|uniref:carboxylating nicotinate-nucleotide diphosphorylase n=1 Tax=Corynebacterium callunae TaxID=1721 RepID=UPI003982D362
MHAHITALVSAALAEDAPWGDITSENLVPASAGLSAQLVAREPGVFSGVDLLRTAFELVDPSLEVELYTEDGARFAAGETLAAIHGSARAILRAERIALNFVQRTSAIATTTSRYVDAIAGTKARIVDTRKTTPGLRLIERQAVRNGGGFNHRTTLSDAVMVKDNHLASLLAAGIGVTEALIQLRQKLPHTTHIEVEVDRLDQIDAVLEAGVDTIMLDNFSLADLEKGVAHIGGRALVEASGGVNLDTVAAIAATGVDIISVGALTHSIKALDLGLDVV